MNSLILLPMSGNAVFGPVQGLEHPASFSLTLGAYSDNGAVVFSRVGAERPKPGTYRITPFTHGEEGSDEFHALVSLGSPANALGAFHGETGTVTITKSGPDQIVGHYELKAVGFLAADMDNEEREITVRGSFAASASAAPSAFRATVQGALGTTASGAAEFGPASSSEGTTFSLTMGANGDGAVVLSLSKAPRPSNGVYRITALGSNDDGQFHGLVITGATAQPTGVFRIKSGTLTVTASSAERMSGTFELQAEGFLARDVEMEDRTVTVSGTFSAVRSTPAPNLTMAP